MLCVNVKILDKINHTFTFDDPTKSPHEIKNLILEDIAKLTVAINKGMDNDNITAPDERQWYWMSVINDVAEKFKKEEMSNNLVVILLTAIYNLDNVYKCKGFSFKFIFNNKNPVK